MAPAVKNCQLAEVHPKGYPTELADEKFAELVKAKTKGKINIQVFFSSQLGTENEVVEQAKLGVIQFVRVSTSPVITVYPAVGVLAMPYIFRSQDHMWKVLNGPVGATFLKGMESVGLTGLAYFEAGSRNFYANKPLNSLADFKGLKIRVQQNPIHVKMVQLLGATAIPIAYGEVYSALQTGVVDGAENNIPSWISASHYEVAKNFIRDEHLRQPEILMVSKKFFDSLSKSEQKAIRDAAKEATAYQINAWNVAEKAYEVLAVQKGCKMVDANIAEFQAAMAPLYKDYPEYKEWVDKINATK
jgi:tripartite ATP-independent transporter DctP family solute receptor